MVTAVETSNLTQTVHFVSNNKTLVGTSDTKAIQTSVIYRRAKVLATLYL
jgi:hypothetical protein